MEIFKYRNLLLLTHDELKHENEFGAAVKANAKIRTKAKT